MCCPDLKLWNQCFHTAFTQHSSEISVRMYISLQTKTFVACHCHKNQFTAYHTEPSHGDNISIHHTDGATGIIKFLCLGTCMYFYMYLQGWHFSVVHYFLSNLKKKFQKIQNSWFCLSAANLALFCLWKLLHLKIALKSPNQMFNFHDHNIWPGNNLSSVGTLNIELRNPSSKVS